MYIIVLYILIALVIINICFQNRNIYMRTFLANLEQRKFTSLQQPKVW